MIYLDTHVVAWLYAGRPDLLSPVACSLIDEHDLLISPMVALELQYLFEVKRASKPAAVVIPFLQGEIGLGVCTLPFHKVAAVAIGLSWTRDPFDRLIVAQAALAAAPLVTKDETIREHYSRAVWLSELGPTA